MKILVSMRMTNENPYQEMRDAISHDWIFLFKTLNIIPILVPNDIGQLDAYFKLQPNGVLLTGGNDIGLLPSEPNGPRYSLRDHNEFALISSAIKHQIPIFGVCRGMQLLNTYFGGTIARHLKANHTEPHYIHWKNFFFGYQPKQRFMVNSYHNHGLYAENLAPDLIAMAHSEDGSIEAILHKNLAITAIQWHPERENLQSDHKIQTIFKDVFLHDAINYTRSRTRYETETADKQLP